MAVFVVGLCACFERKPAFESHSGRACVGQQLLLGRRRDSPPYAGRGGASAGRGRQGVVARARTHTRLKQMLAAIGSLLVLVVRRACGMRVVAPFTPAADAGADADAGVQQHEP